MSTEFLFYKVEFWQNKHLILKPVKIRYYSSTMSHFRTINRKLCILKLSLKQLWYETLITQNIIRSLNGNEFRMRFADLRILIANYAYLPFPLAFFKKLNDKNNKIVYWINLFSVWFHNFNNVTISPRTHYFFFNQGVSYYLEYLTNFLNKSNFVNE